MRPPIPASMDPRSLAASFSGSCCQLQWLLLGLSSDGQVLSGGIAGKSSVVELISKVSTACPGSLGAFSHAFSGGGGVTNAQKTAFRSSH